MTKNIYSLYLAQLYLQIGWTKFVKQAIGKVKKLLPRLDLNCLVYLDDWVYIANLLFYLLHTGVTFKPRVPCALHAALSYKSRKNLIVLHLAPNRSGAQ